MNHKSDGKSFRKKVMDSVDNAGLIDDIESNGGRSFEIGGNKLDHDRVALSLLSEFESLKSANAIEMAEYNKCYDHYSMSPDNSERVGLSKTISPIVYEKIEWISSTINKLITESADAYSAKSLGHNNTFTAKVAKLVLNDCIGKGSDNYNTISDVIRNMFIAGNSYIKSGWGENRQGIGCFTFSAIPNEHMYWDHDYSTFAGSPCFYQTSSESMSDIILWAESDGDWMPMYLGEALSMSNRDSVSHENTDSNRRSHSSAATSNSVVKPTTSRGMYNVIECWTKYDINGDGVAEDIIAVFVNEKLVRMVENEMPGNNHPYLCSQGRRSPFEALGWTMSKILGHYQNDATKIDRLIINNIASQDNGIMLFNELSMSPLGAAMHKRGIPRTVIPVRGDPASAMSPAPTSPLAPHIPAYKAEIVTAADGVSGFAKSTSLDIQMLKGTANNGNIVNSSGQVRVWEDIKRLIETLYKPLAEICLDYHSKWFTAADFKKRFGIDLTQKEVREVFSSSRYKIETNISLPTDDSDKLEKMMAWMQYSGNAAQQGQQEGGNITPEMEKMSLMMNKVAMESAKLMGLTDIERELRDENEDYVGINGLSISADAVDDFKSSVSGSDRGGASVLEAAGLVGGIDTEEIVGDVRDPSGGGEFEQGLGDEVSGGVSPLLGDEADVEGDAVGGEGFLNEEPIQ